MLRSSLISAGALILCCTASAQQQQVQAKRITMPTKNAGIYHVATGTWTRGTDAQANLGPDVIYRADAPSGYFGVGWNGAEGTDEVVLPGTGNPKKAGTQDAYFVDGFTFNWCSLQAGPFASTFKFYDSYVPCDDPDIPANCIEQAGCDINIALPAGGFCWTATIDLAGSGYEVCLEADGGPCAPGYQGGGLGLDHGGWGWINFSTATTGPFLNGYDPNWAPEGGGTCYDPSLPCVAGATGLGAQDLFGIGTPLNGCFWFGGYNNTNGCGGPSQGPGAQFLMIMYTDCTQTCTEDGNCGGGCTTNVYCDTNPANGADLGIDSCTTGGAMNLLLSGAPATQFGYPIIGSGSGVSTDPPGAQGDLCLIGAAIGRYSKDAVFTDGTGAASVDIWNSVSGGGGGGIPNPPGGTLAAGQTWNFQWWHRDGMNPSKFSKALTVTFQ